MPTRKKRDGLLWRTFQKFDLWEYQIGFNIDGQDSYRTIPGTCISLFIIAWCALVLHYLIIENVIDNLDRPVTSFTKPNFYKDSPISDTSGFYFAVGMSDTKNFYQSPD